jgi:cell division septal protein FtsQ
MPRGQPRWKPHPRRWNAPARVGLSLFWRTFFLLALLLMGSIVAWLQTFVRWSSSPVRCRPPSRLRRWST